MLKAVHDESEGCNKSELDLFTVPVDYYHVSTLGEDSGTHSVVCPWQWRRLH